MWCGSSTPICASPRGRRGRRGRHATRDRAAAGAPRLDRQGPTRAAGLSARDRDLPAAIPKLGAGDRGRRGLDLRAAHAGRGGRRRQLGAGAPLPGSGARARAYLVPARARQIAVALAACGARRHDPAPDADASGRRGSGRGRHTDRRHDAGSARAPPARRARPDRLPGARRPHGRRRARYRRSRHRDPGARRTSSARAELRLGQQSDPLAHGGRLERAPPALRAPNVRPRRPGVRRPSDASRTGLRHQRDAARRALRHLRCVSHTYVPADELFAAPGSGGRTFESFLEASGRVEAIWYPFTEAPWLKVWTLSRRKPASSRAVTKPYNYPFSDTLTEAEQQEIRQRVLSDPSEAVGLGADSYADTVAGLRAENSADIWGASKDVLLYVRPQTLRVTANGYAILTRRRDVQRVISEFVGRYRQVAARYRAKGLYPAEHASRNPSQRARPSPRHRPRRRTARAAIGALSA